MTKAGFMKPDETSRNQDGLMCIMGLRDKSRERSNGHVRSSPVSAPRKILTGLFPIFAESSSERSCLYRESGTGAESD